MSIIATMQAYRSTIPKVTASVYLVFLTVGHSHATIMSERSELTPKTSVAWTTTNQMMVQTSGDRRGRCLAQCEKGLAPCIQNAKETKIPGHQDPHDYCVQERDRCKGECRG
jgi:hypothetical protein